MSRASLLTFLLLAAGFAGCTGEPAIETKSCVDCAPPDPKPVTCPDGTEVPDDAPCPEPEPATPADLPWHPSDGAAEVTDLLLQGSGDHQVPATVYRPLVAGPDTQVPVLLHSHGWAGARTSDPDAFLPYLQAGFGIVSLDMRGHGAAADTSVARVHSMEYEIKDVQAVVDEVATWEWVHLDALGDPRLGALGGSYGGGYQLLLAAVDDRIDALAPQITWHDLLQSLAPDGAPKSAWLDLLYWGAHGTGTRLADEIHQGYAWVQAENDVPDGSTPGQVDLATPFAASSPKAYPGAIDVPSLIIQGAPDTLFSFNEAVANYEMIAATGAPVRLVTHLHGHILNTNGTMPDGGSGAAFGLQPPAGSEPCGDRDAMVIAWYERHLIGRDVATGPGVCLALEGGGTVTGDAYPLDTQTKTVALGDGMVAVGPRAAPLELEVLEADAPTVVAGVPRLRADVETVGGAIVYWTLEKVSGDARHVVLSQVTPTRLSGTSTLDIELLGVALELAPGDRLLLVASDRSAQYAHNESRTPGLVSLSGMELDLPALRPAAAV